MERTSETIGGVSEKDVSGGGERREREKETDRQREIILST